MKDYKIGMLINAMGADGSNLPTCILTSSVHGISTDSRTIKPGEVFFAIKGENYDGSCFVEKVIESGALLAVVNKCSFCEDWKNLPIVSVNDTIKSLGDAAADYRTKYDGKVIAITGTSGKTTAKEMTRDILAKRYMVHSTPGNFNNSIGLPLSVFGLDDDHRCAVFELGMSAKGEIAYLSNIVKPQIGVIMNVGHAHMEHFNSLEEVAEAKMELLNSLQANSIAIVNGDDPLLAKAAEKCNCRMFTFGMSEKCNYKAEKIITRPDGCISFEIENNRIDLKVPGLHTVYNALAAYTVGTLFEINGSSAAKTLSEFDSPDKRMQVIVKDGIKYINDSYNANPLSMDAAAAVLESMETVGRKIAVLGDMLELGIFAEDSHYKIGKRFSKAGVEKILLLGNYSDQYAKGAIQNGMAPENIIKFENIEKAAEYIEKQRLPGDVFLIKGSRAMGMERILRKILGSI